MNPFETRRLGLTKLSVARIGMGCGTLGDPFEVIPDEQAGHAIEAAWQAGIRYFDTSPWYGIGKSEHRVGRALRRKPRGEYTLSTKVGRVLHRPHRKGDAPYQQRWRGGLPFDLRFDYTRDGVLRSHEDSLQRLGIPSVDALVIHDLDLKFHQTPDGVDERLDELDRGGGYLALSELKSQGGIQAIGAGINHTGLIPLFLDRFEIDFFLVAMPYTLLDQPALEEELPLCLERDVSVVIGAPFASGLLATGTRGAGLYSYLPPGVDILGKVQRIELVCKRHGVPLAAAALQFPLGHPAVAAVIPGPNSSEQATANVDLLRLDIPRDFWAELKHEGLLRADAPVPSV